MRMAPDAVPEAPVRSHSTGAGRTGMVRLHPRMHHDDASAKVRGS